MDGDGINVKVLEGFHHWVDIQIVGKMAHGMVDREWKFPPVTDAPEIAGLWTIKYYIKRRQDTITVHIAFHPIYELCIGAKKIPGSSRFMRWWDQDPVQELE